MEKKILPVLGLLLQVPYLLGSVKKVLTPVINKDLLALGYKFPLKSEFATQYEYSLSALFYLQV